ncbi:MAG: YihY/virulence factor BrkB family protein [Rhodospirillales bacterium]|nr:YihY/virulence factor BrkB family protein [Rhodospirillales bacterium]
MTSSPVFLPPVARFLWRSDLRHLPRWQAILVRVGRILYDVVRDVMDGNLTLHATSLVYTTLLSLVPLLAFSFSVLKSFGVHNFIEPILLSALEPLGSRAGEITGRIVDFVDNMRVGVLGAVGLGLLVWTVISLMQKIEASFNETWRIGNQRSMTRRFSDFLSVILIGPLLMFSAFGVSASLSTNVVVEQLRDFQIFGWAIDLIRTLTPYLMIVGTFTFLYVFIPNTRVQLLSAFIGAVFAGILWVIAGSLFASFVAGSTNYTAIYSALATPILFMIWLYVSWLILLVGASIAFYHQHPESVRPRRVPLLLSNRLKERTAFQLMIIIGRDYYRGAPCWPLDRLAKAVNLAGETCGPVLEALEAAGLLKRTADKPPCYLPARPMESTPLSAVMDAVRAAEEQSHPGIDVVRADPPVERLTEQIDRTLADLLERTTIKELALDDGMMFDLKDAAEPPAEVDGKPGRDGQDRQHDQPDAVAG